VPTFERLPRFDRDWAELDRHSQDRFREIIARFAADLGDGAARPLLPVTAIAGAPGVLEMTFASDARATISVAAQPGQAPHVIWRRIGSGAARQAA